jgi:glycosyltransferase involved in cell wall biosynthesis
MVVSYPPKKCRLYRQQGKGKGDAVRLGFEKARGDVLMILDADMTVPPEDLPRFYQALIEGKGEFVNGVRLVYPLENRSMRFFNILGNKFFSLAFSWLLDQPIKDTLCGTKVLTQRHYRLIANNRHYFGEFDPFGDFDLLFGAARMNLKIVEMPIRYRARTYGSTNIDRWRHGVLLLKMVVFAAKGWRQDSHTPGFEASTSTHRTERYCIHRLSAKNLFCEKFTRIGTRISVTICLHAPPGR